jgi:hypothetical protein
MSSRNTNRRRSAFTLIELVVVMILFDVFFLLLGATIWGALKIERSGTAHHDRLRAWMAVANQFREDAAQAIEAPDTLGALNAGPGCLILKMSEDRSIVYRWENGDLWRRTQGVVAAPSQIALPIGDEDVSVAFDRSALENRLVTLRIIESRGAGESRMDHTVEISAALGGDIQ